MEWEKKAQASEPKVLGTISYTIIQIALELCERGNRESLRGCSHSSVKWGNNISLISSIVKTDNVFCQCKAPSKLLVLKTASSYSLALISLKHIDHLPLPG